MNDYDDEPQFQNPSYNNNRLLIEDPDDQFVRSGGGSSAGNRGFAPRRNLGPLIEEEPAVADPDISMSLGMPKLQEMANAKKHAAARGIFNARMRNKLAANPWTELGQQTEKNVYGMFGEKPRDFEGTARLFGRKAGNFRSAERENAKGLGFWGRFKQAFNGKPDAPKRTWMERLFGARKKSQDLTPTEKGAFKAQRKGASWANALAPMNDDGTAKFEDWKDENKPSGSVVQIEDKAPAQGNAQPQSDAEDSLVSKELPQQQAIEEEEKEQDDNQTIDDNSIDNDDEEEENPEKKDLENQLFQNYMQSLFN